MILLLQIATTITCTIHFRPPPLLHTICEPPKVRIVPSKLDAVEKSNVEKRSLRTISIVLASGHGYMQTYRRSVRLAAVGLVRARVPNHLHKAVEHTVAADLGASVVVAVAAAAAVARLDFRWRRRDGGNQGEEGSSVLHGGDDGGFDLEIDSCRKLNLESHCGWDVRSPLYPAGAFGFFEYAQHND